MSKILVTGANGFVGKHLINELTNNNYSVLAVGGSQVPPTKMESGQEFVILDLTNPTDLDQVDFSDISGVIHLAGLAAVAPSFDKPMEYINGNIGMQVNLFEAALKQGVKPRFIIISSGTLYDPKADQPLTENSPVLPNSPYAVSKIGQEQIARYYTTRGFECIIARPFNHVGPGQGPGFIMPDLAKQIVAVQKGEQDKVMVGNLDAQRDYTDVRDIVRAYRLLLEKGQSGAIYNICSGQPLSGHQILDGLTGAAKAEFVIAEDESKMRPSDTPIVSGSHDKLSQDTGWQPEIDLDITFRDVIDYWLSQS